MEKKIAVIRGDGIGPEIVAEAIGVLDAVAAVVILENYMAWRKNNK